MELALGLGETPKPFPFLEKTEKMFDKDGVFCMGLGPLINGRSQEEGEGHREEIRVEQERRGSSESDPRVQLNLLPFSPVPRNKVQVQVQRPSQLRFPWLTDKLLSEPGPSNRPGRELDLNCRQRLLLAAVEEREDGAAMSSPNSAASSFQMEMEMDLSIIYTSGSRSGRGKRDAETSLNEVDTDHQQRGARASSRTSDEEEEYGLTRKKLRLSKDQSAFLEESFKEHNTLNPKQKLALAMQLNLRPRQVEVWFQNRRARTKLKQTEVDCEYLKKCCETLTEENKRLQKELQELRALKASQPFCMQLPATTLTMCPSCERVASTTTTTTTSSSAAATTNNTTLALVKSRLYPLTTSQAHAQQASS